MSEVKPKSFIARMRAKLNRPGSWLSYDLANLVPGRAIDAEVLDELETRLLTADVGVEATGQILEELRKKVARKELDDVDALIAALTDAVARYPRWASGSCLTGYESKAGRGITSTSIACIVRCG